MITKLTKAQEAKFEEYRNKWVKYGLSTEPADKALAEKGVKLAYEAAGLKPPSNIVWAKGPLEGSRFAGAAAKASDFKEFNKLKGHATPDFSNRLWAQFEAGWCSYYDYFQEVCGLDCVKPLEGLLSISKSASWWWAFDELAILVERPSIIARDEQGRLHSATGPVIAFGDGFEFCAWHGTVVPADWLTKALTPAIVLNCTNVEQRRAGAEILGWARILRELNVKVLDTDQDPMMGQLLEVDLPEAPASKFLRVQCGTGRTFCLPVPPTVKTALEANAWTYGVEVDFDAFRSYKVRT